MERNFFDMTKVNGKTIQDSKRIQAQTADFLKNYDTQLKESLEAEINAKNEAAMSGARFGYAANIARTKNRVNKLNEEIRYLNESSIIGMTEMVAKVVEAGLLLDESELTNIYPEYKEDIRSIIKDFLKEEDCFNENMTNKKTLALMEYVGRQLPSVREGVSLTEDELSNYVAVNTPLDIDKSIRDLGGDVASRVAMLMEKEQKKAEDIKKEVKRAKAQEEKASAKDEVSAEEIIAKLENGELSEEDLNEMLKDGTISQKTYDEVVAAYEEAAEMEDQSEEAPVEQSPVTTSAEAPVEDDEEAISPAQPMEDPNAAEMVQEPGNAPNVPADSAMSAMPQTVSATPRKQVQMLPDGTMNINIFESSENSFIKHQQAKAGYKFTKQGRFDGDFMADQALGTIKSCLGLDIATLALSCIPVIGGFAMLPTGIAAAIRRYGNSERANSEAFKELKEYCMKDQEVKTILKKIQKELTSSDPDTDVLKGLRSEFKQAIKAAKDKFRENLKEFVETFGDDLVIYENNFSFVRETPRCGLIESLAVNEAVGMLSEGKEYDGDLCLAKAIMYVTITEALDELDIIKTSDKKYAEIISAAGGKLTEAQVTIKQKLDVGSVGVGKNGQYGVILPSGKAVSQTSAEGVANARRYEKKQKDIANQEQEKAEREAKKQSLKESVLVTQYKPIRNDLYQPDSIAERIRKKRLNEQQNINLNE